jgi:ankyrin repeat protein
MCGLLLNWNPSLASRADESGRTPLHYVGLDALAAKLILEKEPSSGYCADSEGSLPIHVAASWGRLHVIKALLEKCTDCDAWCNASGQTFLHVAVDKGHDDIVKYVCTEPRLARILNIRDHNGDTALHLAVQNGKDSIFCRLLGKREVCLNFINKQQHTPLDLAFLSVEKEGYRKVRAASLTDQCKLSIPKLGVVNFVTAVTFLGVKF